MGSLIKSVGQSMGVKYKEVIKSEELEHDNKIMPQDLPVETVLKMLGGKGTKVVRK